MQQADRAFWRGGFRLIARAHYQRADIEIVALPLLIDRDREIQPVSRNVNLLPPERTFAGLDHRIAFTGGRCGDVQLNGIARFVRGFIELHGDAIRACRTGAVAVILPAVAGPETHAADGLIRAFDLQTIGAPVHREGHFAGLIGLQRQALLAFYQIFLVELRLPAIVFRPVPEVVAALADQAHLQVADCFFVALRVGIDNIERGVTALIDNRLIDGGVGAVVIDRF